MIQRDRSFYDLIAYGLRGASYQQFVDRFEQLKYDEFNTDGFTWDPQIQIDFTYEQLQATLGVATLPTYVDIDSPAPYKSQEGFSIGTNKIPRFKHGFAINEKIIREKMVLVQEFGQAALNQETVNAMTELLFDSTDKLIRGNYNALTYQRMQVVSTGYYSITPENNPQGIVDLTFDFGIPAPNRITLAGNSRWWTAATHDTANEGSDADPIKDMQEWKKEATRKGVPLGHYEMSLALWDDLLTHSAVLKRIGILNYPMAAMDVPASQIMAANNIPEDVMKNNIERLVGCPIIVRDTFAYVEKLNKTTKKIEKSVLPGFEPKNLAYVPNAPLGTIKAVRPIAVPDPGSRIAFFDGGRTVLKQTFNTETNTQYIWSECTALVVPSVAQYMFVMKVTA